MQFQLAHEPIELKTKVHLGDKVALVGSCFSVSMAKYFEQIGLATISNPFGVIFHPIALSRVIRTALSNSIHVDAIARDNNWFSWNASGEVNATSEEGLKELFGKRSKLLKDVLSSEKSVLVITFGTAFGYRLNKSGELVANCHKVSAASFTKELSSVDQMYAEWAETIKLLQKANPDLRIILTVSPVRHTKDGITANNRSKGRLIELTHRLCEDYKLDYFPAYELLIDVLRDYRFYAEDLIHPSEIAVKYIWNEFLNLIASPEDLPKFEAIAKYHKSLEHRVLFPGSNENALREQQLHGIKQGLLQKYPTAVFK